MAWASVGSSSSEVTLPLSGVLRETQKRAEIHATPAAVC